MKKSRWYDVAEKLPKPNTGEDFVVRKILRNKNGEIAIAFESAIYITFDARAFFASHTTSGEVTHWQRIPKNLAMITPYDTSLMGDWQ